MHRTLVQLDDPLYKELRQKAFERGISLAGLVRELLSKALGRVKRKKMRIDQFKFIGSGHSREKLIAEDHNKYLGEDFLK